MSATVTETHFSCNSFATSVGFFSPPLSRGTGGQPMQEYGRARAFTSLGLVCSAFMENLLSLRHLLSEFIKNDLFACFK